MFSLKPHSLNSPYMIECYFTTLGSSDTLLATVLYHVLQIFLDLQDSPISGAVSCCHPSAAAQSIQRSTLSTTSMSAEGLRLRMELGGCCLAVSSPGRLTVAVKCHHGYLHLNTNRSCRFSKALQGPGRQGGGVTVGGFGHLLLLL